MRQKGLRLNDVELETVLEQARQYEPGALAKLCEYFYPRVYHYIYYRVNTREDVEDITNEVFLRMVKSIKKQQGSIHAWIFRIAANIITDYYRRRAVRRNLEQPPESTVSAVNDNTIKDSFLEQERLKQVMLHLTEDQQQVIILKFIEGYENDEIANILGKSVEAIRALQFRALTSLRKLLREE